MTNHANILRALVIYGICLPLAILLGYLLTSSEEALNYLSVGQMTSPVVIFGIVMTVLVAPFLLRFHHTLLLVSWNASALVFFLPGRPNLWLAMAVASFLICVGSRTLDKKFRFISVPNLTRPIVMLTIVIVATAMATGGVGLRAFGGDVYGGRRYFIVLGIIMGYFALTSKKISAEHATLFAMLFFLSGVTNVIGDFAALSPLFRPLAFIFPPNGGVTESSQLGTTRYTGLSAFSSAFFAFMMARYGVRGIFADQRPLRTVIFVFATAVGLLGGFRSFLISIVLIFSIQFVLEGMHRTKLMPIFLFLLVSTFTITLPFISQLPPTLQRSVAFVPFLPIDPQVQNDAQVSSDWRLNMWKAMLPQVPKYLLLGKGYAMAAQDFTFATEFRASMSGDEWMGAAAAGDYHNGPLSVVLTFGIWGLGAFAWFLAAGCRVLYNNYRYGDPNFRVVNAFLLAAFVARIITFTFVVGGLQSDLQSFCGWLGLSVCLNGGMVRPVPETVPVPVKPTGFTSVLPRPRSVFSR